MKNMSRLLKRMSVVYYIFVIVVGGGLSGHPANGFGQDLKVAGQWVQIGTQ